VAALSKQEKLQPLQTLLARLDPKRSSGRQTPQEQRAAMMQIAAMNGLHVRVKES
jgi:hypothetical protein